MRMIENYILDNIIQYVMQKIEDLHSLNGSVALV